MTQSTVLKYRDGNFYDKDGKEVTATGARIVPVDMGNASHKTPSPRQPVSAVSTPLEESGSSSASTTGSPFATQIVYDLALGKGGDRAMCARVAPMCARVQIAPPYSRIN